MQASIAATLARFNICFVPLSYVQPLLRLKSTCRAVRPRYTCKVLHSETIWDAILAWLKPLTRVPPCPFFSNTQTLHVWIIYHPMKGEKMGSHSKGTQKWPSIDISIP